MTVCSYCRYYLNSTVKPIILLNKTSYYEIVFGLLAYCKNIRLASLTAQTWSISKFGKIRLSVT